MRISFIEPHLELYGGIRRILEFANRFVARGEDVTVYYPAGKPCRWMKCEAAVANLKEFFKTDHDVVIFNSPADHKHVRKSRAGLKVFYILALYEREKLKRFDAKIFWPRKGRMLLLKHALKQPCLKVSNATWMQRWLRENLGIETHLQFGGINRDLFHPVETGRRGETFRILCSGDPRKQKGTSTVIEAVERVRKDFPNVELDTYYGKGIPQEEMSACYSSADLFVDAQWYAGWNNPVVEAMACGTPVLCTDIGGVEDFAFHEETALLVPVRSPGRLAEAMATMIAHPELRKILSDNALRHVERFDWDRAADQFLRLLHEEIGRLE